MRDDLQNLQQAYQKVLEEGLMDGLKKAHDTVKKAIVPVPVDKFVKSAADKMSKTFLDPWMKKKPAPALQAAPTPKQNFFRLLDAAAEAAGLTQYIEIPGDPAPGTREYSKNGKVMIQISADGSRMHFYDEGGEFKTIDLSYSAEDIDRAKAIMRGEKYQDPADRPWGLHPSDPRR